MSWIRLSDVMCHDNMAGLEVGDIDVDIIRDKERPPRSDASGVGMDVGGHVSWMRKKRPEMKVESCAWARG